MKVKYLISDFFQLVLRILFKLIPDTVNKGLEILEHLFEKNYKFELYDRSNTLLVIFILSSPKANSVTKK